ncbi:transcriptional regulator [Alicyclobacillus contaminans]|uniref:LCP family protein n=1 Tax=Alicyclobacillus contaminans TaxID=392016 RepID=UPI00041B6A04|nr:LCP family protein [Alicyclobacillus contaminans]GMA52200.1 transcriptional regulator [Alicyclobacillus contaminans]
MKRFAKTVLTAMTVLVAVIAGGVGYAYYTLQPRHHFARVTPVVNPRQAAPSTGVNVLLLGSDARPHDVASHTDSILLCHLDFAHQAYDVLSIPRDSRVYVPGRGYTKLTNVQYLGQANGNVQQGVLDTVTEVADLTGVPIHYYAETNYWGLQSMVDAIGPIQMTIPFRETLTHPWYAKNQGKVIPPGTYEFNGEMVAEVVHERDSLPQGDYSRQQLQEQALMGIAKALVHPANLPKLPAFFRSVPNYLIATNMSETDMLSFALAAKSFQPAQVHYFTIPGASVSAYDDVLHAYSDQIVLDSAKLKSIVSEHFLQ